MDIKRERNSEFVKDSLEILVGLVNKKPVDKIETFDDDDSRVYWPWFEIILTKTKMMLRIEDPENCRFSYDFARSLNNHTPKELAENFNSLVEEFTEFVKDKIKTSERWKKDEGWGSKDVIEYLSEIKAVNQTPNKKDNMIETESYEVRIYIAGDYDVARSVCRTYAKNRGACVTITKIDYVYTGGEEKGIVVGFINYPPYNKEPSNIEHEASILAEMLKEALCQNSYTIWTPNKTRTIGRDKPSEK